MHAPLRLTVRHACQGRTHLQVHAGQVARIHQPRGTVNELNADGGAAAREHLVIDQILAVKVDRAAPVRVVLAQLALGLEAANRPARACVHVHACVGGGW